MLILAKIKTGKAKFSVKKGKIWEICVKSKPERNQANLEIVRELSKQYKSVRIIKGAKSRTKLIEILP
jgi:uncharacterized protein YggU (UPF0235/DUF167 family)